MVHTNRLDKKRATKHKNSFISKSVSWENVGSSSFIWNSSVYCCKPVNLFASKLRFGADKKKGKIGSDNIFLPYSSQYKRENPHLCDKNGKPHNNNKQSRAPKNRLNRITFSSHQWIIVVFSAWYFTCNLILNIGKFNEAENYFLYFNCLCNTYYVWEYHSNTNIRSIVYRWI